MTLPFFDFKTYDLLYLLSLFNKQYQIIILASNFVLKSESVVIPPINICDYVKYQYLCYKCSKKFTKITSQVAYGKFFRIHSDNKSISIYSSRKSTNEEDLQRSNNSKRDQRNVSFWILEWIPNLYRQNLFSLQSINKNFSQ